MQNNAKKTKLPNKTAKNSCFPAATSQKKPQSPMALEKNIGDCFYPAGRRAHSSMAQTV